MELQTVIAKRRSCRAYLDREVSVEQIRECVNAARLAPSACNKQPWRFIAVRDANLRMRICREAILPGIQMSWLTQAPVLMVLCMKKKLLTHILAPLLSGIHYEYIDIGIAGEHLFWRQKNKASEPAGSAGSTRSKSGKYWICR